MQNKPFDEDKKLKYDPLGKSYLVEIMLDWLGTRLVRNNSKEDSADFTDGFWDGQFILDDGTVFLAEVEVKDDTKSKKEKNIAWWGEDLHPLRPFRYSTMDIPRRKDKNSADIFVLANPEGTLAWACFRNVVLNAKVKIKPTIHEPNGGPYFTIPVNEGAFLCKVNGRWQGWKPKC